MSFATALFSWFRPKETTPPPLSESIEDLLNRKAPLLEIKSKIWFHYNFESTPISSHNLEKHIMSLLELYHPSESKENQAHIMLLLGRYCSLKNEILLACRLYRGAESSYESEYHIIAMEFLREELRTNLGKEKINLNANSFREKYKKDSTNWLVKQAHHFLAMH